MNLFAILRNSNGQFNIIEIVLRSILFYLFIYLYQWLENTSIYRLAL